MQSSDAFLPKYSQLVFNGFWFSPEREALQMLVTETQRDVTGIVRLKAVKGQHYRRRPQKSQEPLRSGHCHHGNRRFGLRTE